MKNHTLVAVDVAKNVFEVAMSTAPGTVCLRKRLSREQFTRYFGQQKSAKILLEACGSAHHWARLLSQQGHSVVLSFMARRRRRLHPRAGDTSAV